MLYEMFLFLYDTDMNDLPQLFSKRCWGDIVGSALSCTMACWVSACGDGVINALSREWD